MNLFDFLTNGGITGQGVQNTEIPGLLTPDDAIAARNRGLMGMAQGLLSASGWSDRPTTFGQALGAGIQGYYSGSDAATDSAFRRRAYEDQMTSRKAQADSENQKFNATLARDFTPESVKAYLGSGDPASLRRYPATVEPTSLQRNLESAGLIPGTPEYRNAVLESINKPQVSINNAPKLMPGYTWANPNDPGAGIIPIPGSPEARAISKEEKEKETARREALQNASIFHDTLSSKSFTEAVGPVDQYTAGVGAAFGTEAGVIQKRAERLSSQLILDAASMLKGALSDKDIMFLKESQPRTSQSANVWYDWYNNQYLPLVSTKYEAMYGEKFPYGPIDPAAGNQATTDQMSDDDLKKELGL